MWLANSSLIMLMVLSGMALGQGKEMQAERLRRCERGCSGFDEITEANYELTRQIDPSKDLAVVRVCSKESMPIALSMAAINPFTVARALNEGYDFAFERILFLRAEDCISSNTTVAATELWAVPRSASLPSFIESIKSSDARLEIVGRKTLLAEGTRNYRMAVKELVGRIQATPQRVGVIVGYYFKRPSPALKRRLSEARIVLSQSKLSSDRYSVRLMHWPGERSIDPPEPEPKYPNVFIVELAKRKDSARR